MRLDRWVGWPRWRSLPIRARRRPPARAGPDAGPRRALPDDDLERQHPLMSPLVWDLGHIAAYEDLWLVHRHGGGELLRADLAALYDAFETPRAVRGDIPFLAAGTSPTTSRRCASARSRCSRRTGPGDGRCSRWSCATSSSTTRRCARRCFWPACRRPAEPRRRGRRAGRGLDRRSRRPLRDGRPAAASRSTTSARATVAVPAFRIARRPVTNASWRHFAEGGGYERREWWSDEGWAWKEEYDITAPDGWRRTGRVATPPVCTSPGSRPTPSPGGAAHDSPPRQSGKGHRPGPRSRRTLGLVWEWTASPFTGYPGFARIRTASTPRSSSATATASCAAARGPRIRACARTFRNWDLPQRRQIFAGVRLADDGRRWSRSSRGSVECVPPRPATSASLADDVLDGLTKPLKELPPKHFYDARGASCSTRSASSPSTTRPDRAADPRAARRRHRRAHRRVELVELGSGRRRRRAAARAMRARAAGALRPGRRHARRCTRARSCSSRSTRASRCTASSATSSAISPMCPARGPRLVPFLGGTIGNFTPGSRRRFLRRSATCSAATGYLLLGTDLVKDPRRLEAAYDDSAGRHGRVQPQRPARGQPRARRRLRRRRLRSRRVLRPRARVDRDAPARDRGRCGCASRRSSSTIAFAAGEELRTEISAKFTRARLEADLAAAGLELAEQLSDPDGLFALTLARREPDAGVTDIDFRPWRSSGQWSAGRRRRVGARRGDGPPAARARGAVVTIADVNAERGQALAAELGAGVRALRRARGGAGAGRGRRGRGPGLRIAVHVRRHRLGAEDAPSRARTRSSPSRRSSTST